jgi:hypothetical protein
LPSRNALAALLLGALARPLSAQLPAASELDLGPVATWARRAFAGAALGIATRPGGEGRVALVAALGSADGHPAVRLEATAQFLVMPGAKSGVSPYGGVGLAYLGARPYRGAGALVVLLGVEAAPGRPHGWFSEVGLGGGLRLRIGYRWRRLPPWWS